ncbi:ABC transporter permease [Embleya sp. NPDC127516]|uniref:ABC transporter permease n=1 Tax=Embleya sp. NPDC127516 TaxID=3363990 RepID=UPI0037F9016A
MTGREILRRRVVLLLLLLFPLPFYLMQRADHPGQAIRFLFVGLSWAMSGSALFVAQNGRSIDQRLRLSGYRAHHLWMGRMLALWLIGVVVTLPYLAIVTMDQPHVRRDALAVAMVLCVAVAAPFGLLLGALVPGEFEGTLLLLVTVGMQMVADPATTTARLMPFWSGREIGTYAIDHTDTAFLVRGVAHGLVAALVFSLALAAVSTARLRRHRHLRVLPSG